MARRPRLLSKKRGNRFSGWQVWGALGETMFFATLFLLGAFGFGLIVATLTIVREQSPIGPGYGLWTLLIASLSLVAVGISGITYRIANVGASSERRSALAKKASELDPVSNVTGPRQEYPNVPVWGSVTDSPGTQLAFRLPTIGSPVWQLSAAATLALLWNGCALSMLGVAVISIAEGRIRPMLILLIAPIFAAGVWTARRFIEQFRKWSGVGPTIAEISQHPLEPGQACEIYVAQHGRLTLKSLLVELACEEESSFCQGTDVRVEKQQVFHEIVYSEDDLTIDPGKPWEQKFTLVIPPTGMHSFKSAHNSISWWITIRGEAKRWPSYFRRYPLVVMPHEANVATNP